LRAVAQLRGFAASYHDPTPLPDCNLAVPLSLLKEVEGSRAEPVYLLPESDGSVQARWQEGAVPQQRTVSVVPELADVVLPVLPNQWIENPPTLRQAIADAALCVDPSVARYALGCIQLRGKQGDVSSADAHQVFRQSGFQFGTEANLLFYPSHVFSGKELAGELPVQFGVTDEHVVLGSGPWLFWLPLEKEATFPNIDSVIPKAEQVVTSLQLSPSDMAFLTENLAKLPGSEDADQPLTLDLNGRVAIRGRTGDKGPVTEMWLCNSQRSGKEIRINTNRQYLRQALQFGFDRLSLFSPEMPIVCDDEQRTYLWAPLTSKDTIPAGKSVVIESPTDNPRANSTSTNQSVSRRTSSMRVRKDPAPTPPSAAAAPTQTPGKDPSVVEQAVALRSSLRDVLGQVNNLLRAIQRQRKQEKFLRTTLASLKELQSVA
jgi:hypothetical protein